MQISAINSLQNSLNFHRSLTQARFWPIEFSVLVDKCYYLFQYKGLQCHREGFVHIIWLAQGSFQAGKVGVRRPLNRLKRVIFWRSSSSRLKSVASRFSRSRSGGSIRSVNQDDTHPDVLVSFAPESLRLPVLAEVKYRSELQEKWDDLVPKFEAARKFAQAEGWVFRIVTERQIRSTLGRSAGLLLPYGRRGLGNPDHWHTLGRTIAKAGRIEIQDLLESIFPSAMERAYLIPSL